MGRICPGGCDHCCSCSARALCPRSHVSSSSKPGFLWLAHRPGRQRGWCHAASPIDVLLQSWRSSLQTFIAETAVPLGGCVSEFFLKGRVCSAESWLGRRLGGSSEPQCSFKLLKMWNKYELLQRCVPDLVGNVKWCLIRCLIRS